MLQIVKEALGTDSFEPTGILGGGSISSGASYYTDNGQVFVKWNTGSNAMKMFEGEKEGLLAILATKTIRCPQPICVVPLGEDGSAALVMQNIFMKPISSDLQQSKLGEQLAKLHRKNSIQMKRFVINESRINSGTREDSPSSESDGESGDGPNPIIQFGFHVPTSCGYHSLDNTWNPNWDEFYIRQRLQPLVETLSKSQLDRELIYTWPVAAGKIEKILRPVKNCKPALLHGDLWSGNIGSVNGEPVIFDPGVFYGHSEFEFGISAMFGGFSSRFFESYHSIIPRADGWEKRRDVYELFHHLNHWNHFGGSSYRNSTMQLMKKIANADVVGHN